MGCTSEIPKRDGMEKSSLFFTVVELWSIWLQFESVPVRLVKRRILTEYKRDITASTIVFNPVSEGSGGPLLPPSPVPYSSRLPPLSPSNPTQISYSYPRGSVNDSWKRNGASKFTVTNMSVRCGGVGSNIYPTFVLSISGRVTASAPSTPELVKVNSFFVLAFIDERKHKDVLYFLLRGRNDGRSAKPLPPHPDFRGRSMFQNSVDKWS
ncbi:hypothetical protein EVAR_29204_1 [Eumeta japonica]|uniref:Uncharacterized protein n=1 Tax=Eumeta variegata TaxID=151549 RepID=A0A4C1VIC3_EUMVA|nr:hypothetical protein EVAR_29204_1 [Eumeta japonica]